VEQRQGQNSRCYHGPYNGNPAHLMVLLKELRFMPESGLPRLAIKYWDVILAYGGGHGIGFEADYSVETCCFHKA